MMIADSHVRCDNVIFSFLASFFRARPLNPKRRLELRPRILVRLLPRVCEHEAFTAHVETTWMSLCSPALSLSLVPSRHHSVIGVHPNCTPQRLKMA